MSQKVEKPVLSGQRIKTRKRDEKEKYDPNGFRDALVQGLERAGGDLEAAYKFLDAAGSKLDYRRYGEVIFDVLIAGGLLLPGGSVSMDGESPKTNTCIFSASEDMETMRNFEQVFVKLMRRYKYLEKMFEEEMKKVLVYLKGFEPLQRIKLARMTALWIGNGCVPPSVLLVLVNEHLLKDNLALEFVLEVFSTVKQERGVASLVTALKKGQLEGRLLEFLPLNRRSEEVLAASFASRVLAELLRLHVTDLVLTFLVHRHGDRTPVPQYVNFSDQFEQLEKLTKPLGYGQLTDAGKRRAYELGNFIRSRYGEHLSPQYNRSEIHIRSTDSTRAKMTVLVEMAGAYSADGHRWSDNVNWVPVPYTTIPLQYDFVMGMNCPRFMDHFNEVSNARRPEMQKHSSVIDRLSSILKRDLRNIPVQIYFAYDVFVSQTSMGLPVKQSIQEMMPEIKMASDTAFDLLFGNETMLPLQAGLLLKEFFEVSYAAIAGEPSPKVRIYSGHDVNVYALEAISRVEPRQGAPPYAALFALELRRVRETGRYVVLPVYVKSPGESVQYLQVKGCELLCDLEQFYEITSANLLDVDEWKRRCNYDRNAKFNFNGFE